jgi:hypothetical protein
MLHIGKIIENNVLQRVRVRWLKTGRPEAVNLKENHVLLMYNALSILLYFELFTHKLVWGRCF